MFRRPRRPFGRRPRRPMPGRPPLGRGARPLHPRMQRELRHANHLMGVGEHTQAAQIFLSLGQRAADRGNLGPAAFLFLQAGRALLLGGEVNQGVEDAQQGLEWLAERDRWPAVLREGERFAQELEEAGQKEAASDFRAWLEELSAGAPAGAQAAKATKGGQIPEKCPYCGASMSLEQVNARGRAAECQYCGSVVQAD